MKLLILAAASLAVVSCASLSLEDLEFHAWKLKFGKMYSSPGEEARRKDIWLSTRRRVLAHNILADQGIKTYRMGMNHLSDMDELEIMTLYSSLLPEDLNSTAQCPVISPRPDGIPLPKSVNWTDKGCVTPVKSQGNKCGSCWAFSAVGALESHTCIKYGQKRLTRLSEQQLVDCSWAYGNHGCDGGHRINAFQYCIHNKGIVMEKYYPYVAKNLTCRFTNSQIPDYKIGARCSGCRSLPGDELSLQRAVVKIGPVSIGISVHPSFHDYKAGVYYEPDCETHKKGRHAMLLVGYGTTREGDDYWLVKNSYGASWGDKGYIRMARNKNNNCGIASLAVFPVLK